MPGQYSGVSLPPGSAARQTKVAGRNRSLGQALLLPLQTSATSHTPASARQTVPAGRRALGGQAGLLPVHRSAMSHAPPDARQV